MSMQGLLRHMRSGDAGSSGVYGYSTSLGKLGGWGTALPTTEDWAPGFPFYVSAASSAVYINTGTRTTAVWTVVGGEGNLSVLTGFTAAVADADALTVGGVIVPQSIVVPFMCHPHATNLTRTLFYAQTNAWTVTGVVVVMDLVDDTAITASICKVTGNNVAVAATTPLHTGTFNMQTTAGTPQVGTLTGTGADLILAATNKIGIIFSGALDVGICSGFIKLKRS